MITSFRTSFLLSAAVLLAFGCKKEDNPLPEQVASHSWADTLSWVTGPYEGVYTSWQHPANAPMTSTSKDIVLVFEPDTNAPGKFSIGSYVSNITLHHDLSLTIPPSYSFFNGQLVIGSNNIQLSYSHGVGSPGGSYGNSFTGTKNL